MTIMLLCFLGQFTLQYHAFTRSPESQAIFIGLTRGEYQITDFSHDPVVLWFWRSNASSPQADTLFRRISLKNNFYTSGVLRREAIETGDYQQMVQKLHYAAQLDSVALENFSSLLALGFKHRDLSLIKAALALPILGDLRTQITLMSNGFILLAGVIFLTGLIYILVKTAYYLPALSHRIGPRKPVPMFDLGKSLILLIPVLVLRNIYFIYMCYGFLLLLVFSKREKNWLRLNIIGLIVMLVFSLPVNHFISFLVENNKHYQLYSMINYDSSGDFSPDAKNNELVAYGFKNQGRLEQALSLYKELYDRGKRSVNIINNLANIYYLLGESARAETLYNHAMMISERGEPYFNMGLLKLADIEYSESSRFMEEARKRRFSSLAKDPVDIKPTNAELYKSIFSEKLKLNGFLKITHAIPLLLLFILSFVPVGFSPPFFCSSCGRPVCNSCVKEIDDDVLCENCFTKFKSTKKIEIEEDLRRSVGRARKRTAFAILYGINILIPGAGLIYIHKHLAGIVLVMITLLGYVPLLLPSIFISPGGWIALPLTPIFIVIAIICLLISYISSFYMIKNYHAD